MDLPRVFIPFAKDIVKVPTHHRHALLFRLCILGGEPDLNGAALVIEVNLRPLEAHSLGLACS